MFSVDWFVAWQHLQSIRTPYWLFEAASTLSLLLKLVWGFSFEVYVRCVASCGVMSGHVQRRGSGRGSYTVLWVRLVDVDDLESL